MSGNLHRVGRLLLFCCAFLMAVHVNAFSSRIIKTGRTSYRLTKTSLAATRTMEKTFPVAESVGFVTGTNKAKGIGRAIVVELLEKGASKIYCTARDVTQLDDLVQQFKGKVVPLALDVTDLNAVHQLPNQCPDVNLVVNNAGLAGGFTVTETDIESMRTEINVNYLGTAATVQAFAPIFKQSSKTTAVVNINSIAGLINMPFSATYSASKAAAHSLTQAQRRELADCSLVIGVYPGPIETDATAEVKDMFPDMAAPSTVAREIVQALENGVEDVFPDDFSRNLYDSLKADSKAVEIQMAQ